MSTANTLFYLTQLPKYRNLVRDEVKQIVVKAEGKNNWVDTFTYENISTLKYTNLCFTESLRRDPPLPISAFSVTEDIQVGEFHIKKDAYCFMNILAIHTNPDEWQKPDEWIPERFDPESPFYLTPSGKKRHSHSFGPFIGGKRICLGKTLAENMAKCILPIVISKMDFEFVNPVHKEKKP